ncbi:hypothetical protein CAI21_07700 [Alkalilimnicola ehrlichii]|uniref:TolC family protein n=1 Tax=Alkalilimnicola ehrlichii TaxID=351052 RepID=A0A3E0WWP6_9GAMM|nr:TolC family protein [Alkalilimnicola ehrlichii]RFA30080.1 hypothetical protein CAI21_07700 [Alkalilimnicola ehrlichii]RFA37424.1 hypothetical protein CAL65_09040 [Alkalilimnicola ehrlichii]
MRTGLILTSLLAGLFFAPAYAADSLLDVYREAQEADPVLRQAQASLGASRELGPQARAALLPSLSLTGSAEHVDQDESDFTSSRIALQLSQPIFRYGSFILQRQATALINQAETEYVAAEQALMLRVTEHYLPFYRQRTR